MNKMSDDFGHFDCSVCDDARAKEHHLEVIRAFVERVMVRLSGAYESESDPRLGELMMGAIRDEVDAMEKQAE